jgi:hypothetical protein
MKHKQPRKKKETTHEKIIRHIQDKNDIITDEDIRDAIVGEAAVNQDARNEGRPDETIQNAAKRIQKDSGK